LIVLIARLLPGRTREPPVDPGDATLMEPVVTVLLPALNEAARIGPCLEGLLKQGQVLREVIVIDSQSSDGTRDLVRAVGARDSRFRLVSDPPRPPEWVGKVWALHHGLPLAAGEWILVIDADTEPRPGMIAAVLEAAESRRCEVVSFSPRFAGMTTAEQWLQPSMLLSLVYRCGAAGAATSPDRMLANGQCFLAKRSVLERSGGFAAAKSSWSDDVTLVRHLARRGARAGFLDGSRLYSVRAYAGIVDLWRGWGRSIDLSDATSRGRQWLDVAFIVLAQGLPLPVLASLTLAGSLPPAGPGIRALVALNAAFVAIRILMLGAIRRSYERTTLGFWFSPLSDPLAAFRLLLSTSRRPVAWRGRVVRKA
jgi:dolichol-phosphate mannosyltransferase